MPTRTTSRPPRSRWREPFTVFQTNLQEIDATMDVEAALDVIESHGADTWLLNAGGIVAFHPTDLAYQTRNPFLADRPSGDLVGDAVTAAQRRGVRVIARLDLSKVDARVAAAHPEWLFTSATGEPQVYNALFSTCPSGGYYQECALQILDEILDRYPVDGFFFNWFNFNERDYSEVVHGVCQCRSCVERFAEFSGGRDLPDSVDSPALPLWLRYKEATLAGLAREYTDHTAPRDRDLALILPRGGGIAYHEGNNAFRHMPGKELWPHAVAEAVSAHVASRPTSPLVLNAAAHIDATYRMGAEQPEHVAQYLLQAIARGGNPSTYVLGAPGRLPMESVSTARSVTRFHREHRDLYAHLRPAATIGLVRPGMGRGGHATYLETLEEFRGIYAALQQKHLPFDVLPLGDLAAIAGAGALERYRLVVLPDVAAIGWEVARKLDEFVARGGNLLSTGDSGITADGGAETASCPARRRIGNALAGKEVWATYATLDAQPHTDEGRFAGSVVPVFGTNARYVWKPGSTKTGAIITQAPWGPPELAYGHTPGGDPAVASTRYGSGLSAMIPWTVGRTYHEFAKTEVRDHLLKVVEPLAGVRVTAELPEQVELVLGRDHEGYVVHLLNQTGARRRSFGPHVPIAHGRLVLRDATESTRADALVAARELATRRRGEALVVDLPVLDLFEVVRIRPA
ncbi:beta-galactosidase trimerization domain-containing protein [Yinghuangia sp. ASG 101]|uniref:alpha-amylase family protein n=1 Tax=Yinghuangia sp. ASG 101 TaxID=2896848 RepID=UPI001E4607D6|nr:alpha-amylase family protein [Yinghuangia sp. ASG 101]UGQ11410.1 beta-galactosidase trimerization domain-containing protein [Yinghuangia sp. ASG 101]